MKTHIYFILGYTCEKFCLIQTLFYILCSRIFYFILILKQKNNEIPKKLTDAELFKICPVLYGSQRFNCSNNTHLTLEDIRRPVQLIYLNTVETQVNSNSKR